MKSRGRSPASVTSGGGGSIVVMAPTAMHHQNQTTISSNLSDSKRKSLGPVTVAKTNSSIDENYESKTRRKSKGPGSNAGSDHINLNSSSSYLAQQRSKASSITGGHASSSGHRRIPSEAESSLSDLLYMKADPTSPILLQQRRDSSHEHPDLSKTPQQQQTTTMIDSSTLGNSIFYDELDSSVVAGTIAGGALAGLALHNRTVSHSTPDPAMTQKALEKVQEKIDKTRDRMKEEQTTQDKDVKEYLDLSSKADASQQTMLKQLFEKKNQKSSQNINHLQQKLEGYNRQKAELQESGLRPRQSKRIGQGLKNVKDGISGMGSSVISKPKELAAHLLNRRRFGSADNLNHLSKDETGTKEGSSGRNGHGGHGGSISFRPGSAGKAKANSNSLPRENSGGGFSTVLRGGGGQSTAPTSRKTSSSGKRKCISDDGRRSEKAESERSAATSASEAEQKRIVANGKQRSPSRGESASHHHTAASAAAHAVAAVAAAAAGQAKSSTSPKQQPQQQPVIIDNSAEFNAVMEELNMHKELVDRLREEMEEMRRDFNSELEFLTEDRNERFRELESQVNDLTELHQREIENIKSGVNDMEEKVQYQSEERLRDISEHLSALEMKLTTLEHQQNQQQYLNIEGLDSSDTRAVMMKFLQAVITLIHVILFVLGTVMNLAKPFLKTTTRALVTIVVAIISISAYHRPETLQNFYNRFLLSTTGTAEAVS